MKNHLILFVAVLSTLFLLTSCSNSLKVKAKFSIEPPKPKPGESITVIYNPDSTGLKDAAGISLMVYSYSIDLDETKQIEMKKTAEGWTAEFTTKDSTKGVLIKFKNDDDIDNNVKRGYLVNLYDANGN